MRYITKGDLLTLLGSDANQFTAFMRDPASFGLTGNDLLAIQIAKQKFDWTNGLNLDLPEIQAMVLMLNSLGVISNESINNINSVADNPEFDTYTVQIIAQDDITAGNPYGAELNGQYYYCKVDFINNTKETTTTEQFVFDKIPNNEEMLEAISLKVKQLKKLSNQ